MIAFLARRYFWFLLTVWVVFTVSFFLMRAVPGGPFDGERKLEPDVKQAIERRYRVNEPLLEQYAYHLGMAAGVLTEEGTFRLGFPDLGPSYRIRDYSVNQIIAQGLPVSASLGILAFGVRFVGWDNGRHYRRPSTTNVAGFECHASSDNGHGSPKFLDGRSLHHSVCIHDTAFPSCRVGKCF